MHKNYVIKLGLWLTVSAEKEWGNMDDTSTTLNCASGKWVQMAPNKAKIAPDYKQGMESN